jgi:hypothetical protein
VAYAPSHFFHHGTIDNSSVWSYCQPRSLLPGIGRLLLSLSLAGYVLSLVIFLFVDHDWRRISVESTAIGSRGRRRFNPRCMYSTKKNRSLRILDATARLNIAYEPQGCATLHAVTIHVEKTYHRRDKAVCHQSKAVAILAEAERGCRHPWRSRAVVMNHDYTKVTSRREELSGTII